MSCGQRLSASGRKLGPQTQARGAGACGSAPRVSHSLADCRIGRGINKYSPRRRPAGPPPPRASPGRSGRDNGVPQTRRDSDMTPRTPIRRLRTPALRRCQHIDVTKGPAARGGAARPLPARGAPGAGARQWRAAIEVSARKFLRGSRGSFCEARGSTYFQCNVSKYAHVLGLKLPKIRLVRA